MLCLKNLLGSLALIGVTPASQRKSLRKHFSKQSHGRVGGKVNALSTVFFFDNTSGITF